MSDAINEIFRARIADMSKDTPAQSVDALLADMVRSAFECDEPNVGERSVLLEFMAKRRGGTKTAYKTRFKEIRDKLFSQTTYEPPEGASRDGLAERYFRKDGFVYRQPPPGVAQALKICSDLRVVARVRLPGDSDWALLVEATNAGGTTKCALAPERALRTDPKAVVGMLIAELGIVTYIRAEEVAAAIYPCLTAPLGRFAATTGWQDETGTTFALPDRVIGGNQDEILLPPARATAACGQAGSFEDWRRQVAGAARGNPAWTMMLILPLASAALPFMPPGYRDNVLMHWRAETSVGKTTGLRMAATVWGPGSEPNGFMRTWRTTMNALEALAEGHSGFGLLLDEITSLRPEEAGRSVYALTSGKGKDRLRADGSAQPVRTWRLHIGSTGEKALGEHARASRFVQERQLDAGVGSRAVDVEMAIIQTIHGAESAATFVRDVAAAAERHYGHAGPRFVEWLIANPDAARTRLDALRQAWERRAESRLPAQATAQARRIAKHIGAVAIGGALAADVLDLPWSTRRLAQTLPPSAAVLDAGRTMLESWLAEHGGKTLTGTETMLDDLRTFITANESRFDIHMDGRTWTGEDSLSLGQRTSRPKLGWIYRRGGESGQPAIIEQVLMLKSAFEELGWDPSHVRQAMRHLREVGLLHTNKPDQLTTSHRGPVDFVQVYKIRGSFFEDDGGR